MIKAYVTTIGELTTQLCCEQLERFGYEVVLLDRITSWWDKYLEFIDTASEDCLRIDADIIPNQHVAVCRESKALITQFHTYDLYKNDIGITSPLFYRKESLNIIRRNKRLIEQKRPEATAWRIPAVNAFTETSPLVVGLHGFCQDVTTMRRAMNNKLDRKQIDQYDFATAFKIANLAKSSFYSPRIDVKL